MVTYRKVKQLQGGAQGAIWLCESESGEKAIAKYLLLTNDEERNAELRRRFQREVKSQGSLTHAGVMPVIGAHLETDAPYFMMPFAESGSLRVRLPLDADPPVPLSEDEAWEIFDQILEVVAFAHENGVVHRDLKPENVLFYGGRAVLSDFGMVKNLRTDSTILTVSGVVLGTWGYIAPEQIARSKEADERCDVYALGRMLHEMLTGAYSPAAIDVMRVPAAFRHIITKATQLDPAHRFQDASEMRREFTLLKRGSEDTEAPAAAVARLVHDIAAGQHDKLDDFVRLVVANDDDVVLLRGTLPVLPESVLSLLAVRNPEQYLAVVRIFDKYADGSFSFEFTDTIARFLAAAYRATTDVRVHSLILRRMLVLGASHSRYYVRSQFVDLVNEAIKEPHYAPIIAGILQEEKWTIDFVDASLRSLSLPRVIVNALDAAA